jgi:hypothetical protein
MIRFLNLHLKGRWGDSYLDLNDPPLKSINKLKDENGDIICKQTELLKEIKRYYEQLYSSKNPNKESLEYYILNTEFLVCLFFLSLKSKNCFSLPVPPIFH